MNILSKSLGFLCLSLSSIGGVAFAQSAPNDSQRVQLEEEGSIIVTAPREVREAVKGYVDTVMRRPKGGRFRGQMSRIVGPICPRVRGLSDQNNLSVEDRIRGVATAAELLVGTSGCKHNVLVLFVPDGPEYIRQLRSERSGAFGSMSIRQRQKLQDGEGPVYGWKLLHSVAAGSKRVRIRGSAAAVAAVPAAPGTGSNTPGGDSALGSDAANASSTKVQSLYRRSTEEAIEFGVLLIEHEAMAGLSIKQLADFAAIYSLMNVQSDFDPDGMSNQTILTLFEDRERGIEPADQVTELDLAVLNALYHSPADVSASLQLSAMLQRVESSLEAQRAAVEARESAAPEGDG